MDGLGAMKARIHTKGYNGSVYADLEVAIVQAKSGKVVSSSEKRLTIDEAADDWADTPAQMTPAQTAKLRQLLTELIPQVVAADLADMGLAPP